MWVVKLVFQSGRCADRKVIKRVCGWMPGDKRMKKCPDNVGPTLGICENFEFHFGRDLRQAHTHRVASGSFPN